MFRTGEPAAGRTPLPPRVTTPLLTLITQQSLDEDYQHVAEQRRDGQRPAAEGRGGARSRLTVVAVAVFGLLVAVAAAQTARNADVTSAGREQLITRIEERNTTVARLQSEIAALREANSAAERRYQSLQRRLQSVAATQRLLASTTGFGTLRGEGVRATVGDAPSGAAAGIVRDEDLALLVNGLLAAGAQGVAVNGQRLTALSALRNSFRAVRVNSVSLSPPYVVEAVGDRRTLQAAFADTDSGMRFRDLTRDLGMPFDMDNVEEMELPAAPARMLALRKTRELDVTKPPTDQEDRP